MGAGGIGGLIGEAWAIHLSGVRVPAASGDVENLAFHVETGRAH